MPKIKTTPLQIVVDTRETLAYKFEKYNCRIIRKALKTSDYSLLAYEDKIGCERKSLSDLFGSVGKDRARFEREIERMSKFQNAYLIIEATLEDILKRPPKYSKMSPRAVIRTLLFWSERYNIKVYFGGNRILCEALVYSLLEIFLIGQIKETKELLKAS